MLSRTGKQLWWPQIRVKIPSCKLSRYSQSKEVRCHHKFWNIYSTSSSRWISSCRCWATNNQRMSLTGLYHKSSKSKTYARRAAQSSKHWRRLKTLETKLFLCIWQSHLSNRVMNLQLVVYFHAMCACYPAWLNSSKSCGQSSIECLWIHASLTSLRSHQKSPKKPPNRLCCSRSSTWSSSSCKKESFPQSQASKTIKSPLLLTNSCSNMVKLFKTSNQASSKSCHSTTWSGQTQTCHFLSTLS